ncbi:MAG: hypothetical protein U5N56_00200 [Candidatus Marinimicrobia bacterium]|nr:hypothetical protein [Candidatus Neomarinimicrobiota bacterium]
MNITISNVSSNQLSLILAIEQSKGIVASPEAVLKIAEKFNRFLNKANNDQSNNNG